MKKGGLYPCPQQGSCVSSAGSAQPSKYVAPWRYKESMQEAIEKLEKFADANTELQIVKRDGSYVWVKYEGGTLGGTADIEFLFRESDSAVSIRAASRRNSQFYAFSVPTTNLKGLMIGIRQNLGWEDLDRDLLLI